ncbi:hypothetical protein [Parasphingorhabdus sp.]|uniref:hypothetical protein n=1 Tax=Parasphingorhabdus sp. TaxID=2709688 RepID=UPI003D2D6F0E
MKDMIFRRNIDQLEDIFLRQFEQEGDRLLYRKHGRGAPIPVSAEEKEQFRLQYRKASVRMIWGASASAILAIVLGVLVAPKFIDEGPGIIVICFVMIGGIAVLGLRNSTSPARELVRRTPVGSELSKDEWQSKHFSTTSWPSLASIFLISTVVCIGLLTGSEFQEWPDYLWVFGSGMLSIFGARALWLKYRLSRRPN